LPVGTADAGAREVLGDLVVIRVVRRVRLV
jgi:hypothetical protein